MGCVNDGMMFCYGTSSGPTSISGNVCHPSLPTKGGMCRVSSVHSLSWSPTVRVWIESCHNIVLISFAHKVKMTIGSCLLWKSIYCFPLIIQFNYLVS